MRSASKIMMLAALVGGASLLSACGSTRAMRPRSERPAPLHRAPAQVSGWESVLPSPEVAMDQRNQDRRLLAEASRRDVALAKHRPEAVDAIDASWPQASVPSLDHDRTGRTSTNPERFIFSSEYGRTYRRGYRTRSGYRWY